MTNAVKADSRKKAAEKELFAVLFVLVTAVLSITFLSKSSPLYPFNDWDDPNCFFTVGKAMANGQVLYRDIFEQKGPVLYMLHSLAYFISGTTFLGVYFIEIAAAFAFLYFVYKTLSLFCRGKILFAIFPFAMLTYSSMSFCCGDSAEELSVAFIMSCLYLAIRALKKNIDLPLKDAFLIGLMLSFVLWIKFTMLGFFIGFVAAFVIMYIRDKKFIQLLRSALSVIAGILVGSLPVFVYFIANNAFKDLFEVYFYDNIFLYSVSGNDSSFVTAFYNLFYGLFSFAGYNTFAFVFSALGYLTIRKYRNRNMKILYLCTYICTFFFSYVGGRFYSYYAFVMMVFAPLGTVGVFIYFKSVVNRITKKAVKYAFLIGFCLFSGFYAVFISTNTYLLRYDKSDLPQFRFNETISKSDSPTLLNYGFLDGGFYTVSGVVPNCKYFCKLNMPYEEMDKVQSEYVNKGLVEFVVTKDSNPDFELYDCVDQWEFHYWFDKSNYFLYRLKSKNIN